MEVVGCGDAVQRMRHGVLILANPNEAANESMHIYTKALQQQSDQTTDVSRRDEFEFKRDSSTYHGGISVDKSVVGKEGRRND